jgi:putative ABC transport system permease protein
MISDLRLALRMLAKSPAFTAVAVLTLAVGIGAATTMFGFLQAVVRFGQPTVPEPERVARLFATVRAGGDSRNRPSLADYRRWSESARSFESLAAYSERTRLLRTASATDEVGVLAVTPSYLSLLKTPPLIGRAFSEDEARATSGRVALLSERAWRSRFRADASILGQSLDLDENSYMVIGVMAERLGLVMPGTDFFVPLAAEDERAPVGVIGRRRAAVSWPQVSAEMNTLGVGDRQAMSLVRVTPILEDQGSRTRALWFLAVGPPILVLLIGCGNVATLLLVRAVNREREIAVRLALGASRRRLAAQLLVESGVMAVFAGALGTLLAWLGLLGVHALLPATVDARVGLDAGTLLFAGIATLSTPLAFGAAPLLHSLRVNLSGALRASLHKPLFGVGRYHVRDLFAVLEVGLSLALVAFTLMLLSFFNALRSPDLTFDAEGLVVAQIRRLDNQSGETAAASGANVLRLVRERVLAVPGVSQVTVGNLPTEGAPVPVGRSSSGAEVTALQLHVDRDYFATLRLRLKRGRAPNENEIRDAAAVAVLNEGAAARLWPNADPVGQVLYVASDGRTERVTIVGVSEDAVRLGRLSAADVYPLRCRYSLYRPRPQKVATDFRLIARVQGQPASLYESMQQAVQSADPRLRLRKLVTVASAMDPTGGEAPFPIYVLAGLGCLALLLAAVGVFGVMSQLVDERRRELGVRSALGASSRQIVALVVRDGLIRVGLGSVIGLVGLALAVRSGFAGLISATAPDPTLWLAVLTAVALTTTAACLVPARRAAKVDPMVTMRCE